MQKFVGTPFASNASLKYARRIIVEYRESKAEGRVEEYVASTSGSRKAKPAAEPKPKRVKFAQKFDGYYSNNACILLAVAGGLLSVWLGELTGINYAILGLVLGVIFTQIGIVPQNLLQKGQTSGFINMVVFVGHHPLAERHLPRQSCAAHRPAYRGCSPSPSSPSSDDEGAARVEDNGR